MNTLHTAILGTDPWGWLALKEVVGDVSRDEIAFIGSVPETEQLELSLDRIPLPDRSFDREFYQEEIKNENSYGLFGGRLVELSRNDEGFRLAVQHEDDVREIQCRRLIVSAPGGADLVEGAEPVAGTDSAVTGLLIENFMLSWGNDAEQWFAGTDDHELLAVGSGFRAEPDGSTPEPGLYIVGLARAGFPDTLGGIQLGDDVPPPVSATEPSTFDWEDVGMPEGFVGTKTTRLKQLLKTILVDGKTSNSKRLLQELEGLAGEIDSYSRFRSDPDLRRLRWKMLAGMNYIRPYLVTSEPSLA